MDQQIAAAKFVLVVCTKAYGKRVDAGHRTNDGKGGQWESFLTYQELYEKCSRTQKFIPVVFSTHDIQYIPLALKAFTRYNVTSEDGYWKLYQRLCGQADTRKPDLGNVLEEECAHGASANQKGKAVEIVTSERTVPFELEIDIPFEEFTEEHEKAIGEAVCKLLAIGSVIVRGKHKGSTKLMLEMTPEQAEELLWRIKRGDLDDLGVIGGRIVRETLATERLLVRRRGLEGMRARLEVRRRQMGDAAFGHRAQRLSYETQHVFWRVLGGSSFEEIVGEVAFVGHAAGPPTEAELAAAEAWTQHLLSEIENRFRLAL